MHKIMRPQFDGEHISHSVQKKNAYKKWIWAYSVCAGLDIIKHLHVND